MERVSCQYIKIFSIPFQQLQSICSQMCPNLCNQPPNYRNLGCFQFFTIPHETMTITLARRDLYTLFLQLIFLEAKLFPPEVRM